MRWLTTFLFFVLCISAWQFVSSAGIVSNVLLPSPLVLARTTAEVVSVGYPFGVTLWTHVLSTLRLAVTGFLIGGAAALILALPLGWFTPLRVASEPVIALFRGIPALAWVPLFILMFGIGDLSKILVVVYGTFWVILTHCVDGVTRVDPVLVRVARVCGASTLQVLTTVVLPAALPEIITGLRVGYAISFGVVLSAELIGAFKGLGFLIGDARGVFRTDVVLVGMLTIGLLAYVTATLLFWLEQRILRWRPRAEGVGGYEQ